MRIDPVFRGGWGLVKAVALLLLVAGAGVWQWNFLQSRHEAPLYGSVRILVIPHATVVTSCADWRADLYVENNTAYPIKLSAYRFAAEIEGETTVLEEAEAARSGLSHLKEIAAGDTPRIAHLADGCAILGDRLPVSQERASVAYSAIAVTSDGRYSAAAAAFIALAE